MFRKIAVALWPVITLVRNIEQKANLFEPLIALTANALDLIDSWLRAAT